MKALDVGVDFYFSLVTILFLTGVCIIGIDEEKHLYLNEQIEEYTQENRKMPLQQGATILASNLKHVAYEAISTDKEFVVSGLTIDRYNSVEQLTRVQQTYKEGQYVIKEVTSNKVLVKKVK